MAIVLLLFTHHPEFEAVFQPLPRQIGSDNCCFSPPSPWVHSVLRPTVQYLYGEAEVGKRPQALNKPVPGVFHLV